MADESAEASSHVSDATTTTEEATITDAITVTPSSSSSGTELYFHSAVIIIGVIGAAANALILYALVASKQHNKLVLIVNQNALDLFSCISLVVTYSVKFFSIPLTGWLGYWLCKLIYAETILWSGISGSIINLALVHSSQIAVNADYDKVDYRTTDSPPTNVLRNNRLTEPVAVPEIERDIEKL